MMPAPVITKNESSATISQLIWPPLTGSVVAITKTAPNKSKAASSLHWSRMTLYRKLAQYNIQRNSL